MSERYSRPHTPPGPPPSHDSRKSYSRGSISAAPSTKSHSSKSYDNHSFDKSYSKSSSSTSLYPSSKIYTDSKYKSSPTRKVGDKVQSSKYGGKKDVYNNDATYKTREVKYPSERYSGRDHTYVNCYSEKGKYPEKYTSSSLSSEKYSSKKYVDDHDLYSGKTSRYPRHDGDGYYNSSTSYGAYDSYSSSSADRALSGSYGVDKHIGGGTLIDYGGRGLGPVAGESYHMYDKTSRQSGYNSGEKHRAGMSVYPREKISSDYGDEKLVTRPRMYPEDDRQLYSSYSPSHTSRSPLRSDSGAFGDYDHYSHNRSPKRVHLDRYVIGDSVVYGSPGHYSRDLRSMSPHLRPPSPPSPKPLLPLYSRYTTSPRRYTSARSPLPQSSSQYQSSLNRRVTSPHRPPSPPVRRPPSPKSPYLPGHSRTARGASYDTAKSKDRYGSKSLRTTRSPVRDRSISSRRSSDRRRSEQDKKKESEKRRGSRERTHDSDSSKRARATDYHNSTSTWTWSKDSNHSSSSQKDRQREDRLPPPLSGRSGSRGEPAREKQIEGSREGERSRRLEDRLGPSPSQTVRSPVLLSRVSHRPVSPRDKRSRRPDDLRLWIESRKSEGGKHAGSPTIRSRPGVKRVTRSSERARLGDPKKRLSGYKTRRRMLPVKRNKILKKYQRISRKRGPRNSGGSGSGKVSKDSSSNRGEEEKDKIGEEESSKPGSTATIRRIIKKPKKVSHVNRLALRPRVIRKPTQKLLKDPKETEKIKEERSSPQPIKESSKSEDKDGSPSDTSKRPSKNT